MNKPIFALCGLLLWCTGLWAQPNAVLTNPSACALNLPLGDATCPENTTFYNPDIFHITINNAPGSTLGGDVYLSEVRLLLEHAWISDVNVILKSPGGISAQLISNAGGNDDDLGDTGLPACAGAMTFKLAACQSVADGTAPFTDGPYRANQDFYVFNDGITNPNSGVWELLICDDLIDDTGILQYVELVFEPLTCLPIQDVLVENVDSTSVTFSYDPIALCGSAVLEIGPPGFSPGLDSFPGIDGQVFYVDCPPITIQNLQEDSLYDVYLRRICGLGTSFSSNSCGNTFRTGCIPAPATVIETFDDQENCFPFCSATCPLSGYWRNVEGDDFDWLTYSGNTPTLVGTGPNDDISGGGKYVYIEANGFQCPSGGEAYLHSGCIELNKAGSDTCHLSFNYHMYGINIGSLRLEASADGGFNWQELWSESGNQGNEWRKAYIGLGDYADGANLQLRFVGVKGFGVYGDIALDQIILHGSEWIEFPENRLYVDSDEDGYGQAGAAILTCLSTAPQGYALTDDDCNDNDPEINPGAGEIPCNFIDENCNTTTLDDDLLLPTPPTQSDTICSDEQAVIIATADFGYFIEWYDNPEGIGSPLAFGDNYTPSLPGNDSPFPESYTFYARMTNGLCSSPVLGEASVLVWPRPEAVVGQEPAICPGESVDLASISIQDAHFTGATISFHTDSPPNPANQLVNTVVSPLDTTDYIFLLVSPQGCTDEGIVTVFQKMGPEISFSPADSFSLCREAQDTVIATASGGAGGFTYFWETGRSGNQLPVEGDFVAGTLSSYALTVTDADGCFSVDSVLINTTNSIDSVKVLTTPVSTCEGSDGLIEIIPLNGLPPFSFSWEDETGNMGSDSGVQDTIRIEGLPQNAYRVTITDNSTEACAIRLRNIRVQGPGFQLSDTDISSPSCAGADDGEICLDVSGSNTITYNWSNGQTAACAINLMAGSYSVTISNGECTTVETYVLSEPDPLVTNAHMQMPSCDGATDGSLEVQVFGGTPNYTYRWENNAVVPVRTNLGEGDYFLTITDGNSCELVDTFSLPAPDPLILVIDSLSSVSCFGEIDGSVLVNASGGTPPYRFQWTDGVISPFRFGLSAGTYTVLIFDFNSCFTTGIVTIPEPDPLILSVFNLTQPICLGDETGAIQLLAQGGTPPYLFEWSDGWVSSSANRTNIGVDLYEVVVTDAQGCTGDPLIIDLSPESNLAITATITEPTCVGVTDGSITVATGGVEPITYNWSTGADSQNLDNIGVGTYGLFLMDDRGCRVDTQFVVSAPQVFNITSTVVQPSCAGVNDGIIDQSFSTIPEGSFSFAWSDISQHVDRFFLSPGGYSFTVTEDGTGCQFYSDTFNLIYPAPLSLDITDSGGLFCAGDSTGFFETTAVGGTAPYTYNWVGTGVNTSNIYNLSAGEHRIIVTDSRSCNVDTLLELTSPEPLSTFAELQLNDICDPEAVDELVAIVDGGQAPYSFEWNSGHTTAVIEDPNPGDYFLSVTDANECTSVYGTVKVQDRPAALELDTFYVDPVSCFGGNDASMTAHTSGGSSRLLYHFTPTLLDTTDANSVTISGLTHALNYSVTVTDLNTGCVVESPIVQEQQPSPVSILRDSFELVSCFGGSDGAVYVTVSGGTQPYSYAWYDQDTTLISQSQDLTFAPEGPFTLIVTDGNLCTAELRDSNVVSLNELIVIADTLFIPVACRGDATGSIDLAIGGGVPPFTYQWSNDTFEEDLEEVPAGNYSLTVTDSDTCRAIFQGLQVTEPATDLVLTSLVDSITCFGAQNGEIEVIPSGGDGPYAYTWRRNGALWPSAMGPLVTNLFPATYRVIVEDTNGCIREQAFQLSDPPELVVDILNEPSGIDSLLAFIEGGRPPYQILWSNTDTTLSIDSLMSGNYSVQVIDENGCLSDASYVLTNIDGELVRVEEVSLFPNPTTGLIQVQFDEELPPGTSWRVWETNGQQLAQGKTNHPIKHWELDCSSWPGGTYWVLFQLRNGHQFMGAFILTKY